VGGYSNRRLWKGLAIAAGALAVAGTLAAAAYYDRDGPVGQTVAAWVQAWGSVLAIVAGFWAANRQLRHAAREARGEKADRARAMASLAHTALGLVADRLRVAARPFSKFQHGLALREHRTGELIAILRELRAVEVPTEVVVPFSTLRSNLFAVNARITEVYRSEEEKNIAEEKRERRLGSSFVTYDNAVGEYRKLCASLKDHHGLDLPDFEEPDGLRPFVEAALARQSQRAPEGSQEMESSDREAPNEKNRP
jgi:ABC-type nickel/cobalt efflux system permease component RcnA